MKIVYFSASVRGGREELALYQEWIRRLKTKTRVLTDFLGDGDLEKREAETVSDWEIYDRDMALLEECDILIAECTAPSLGVGYEIAAAEALGKPVVLLMRKNTPRRLSAMLSGNPRFPLILYEGVGEGWEALQKYME